MRLARAVLLALLLLPAAASAQSQKPIRIIVPFAPGASADGIARAIANGLGERMGKTVVVENSVGAGGSLGLLTVSKSPGDGDTLGVGATGALLINPHLPNSTAPDLLRDLAPVAKLIEVGVIVVANPTVGPKSIQDLIVQSKARPEGPELWLDRRPYRPAHHHGAFQEGDGRKPHAHSLPRQRAGRGRSHGRADPAGGGRHHVGLSARRRRPPARARHGRGEALGAPRRRFRPSRKKAYRASGAPADSSGCSRRRARRPRWSRRSRPRSPKSSKRLLCRRM